MSKKDDRIADLRMERDKFRVSSRNWSRAYIEQEKNVVARDDRIAELEQENASLREQLAQVDKLVLHCDSCPDYWSPAPAPASEPERGPVRRRFVPLAERAPVSEPEQEEGQ